MANLPQLLQPFRSWPIRSSRTLAQTRQSLRHATRRSPPQPPNAWKRQSPAQPCPRAQKSIALRWPANHSPEDGTPCAPQASATSVLQLISNCVREPPSAVIAFSPALPARELQGLFPAVVCTRPPQRRTRQSSPAAVLLLMAITGKLPPIRDVVKLQRHWPAL